MSAITVGLIAFVILFAILALGVPIGFGMGFIGFVGFWYLVTQDAAISKMAITPFVAITSYELAVLPLFLLMAQIIFAAGTSNELYNLAAKWFGHQPGGIAMSTVAACAGFSAVSASSLATASTMGMVGLPEMKKYNYHASLATGCVAAGGTIGILIPPSGLLIIYGIATEQSIGKLFMAGIIPGVLEAVFYFITIYILCMWKPSLGPRGPKSSFKEKILAFKSTGEIIALVFLVLGGLIIGWFTPTEAGAVGAFGALISALIRRRLTWEQFKKALSETMKITGMIYGVLIGAFIFNYFMAVTMIPFWIADVVSSLPLPPLGIMVFIIIIYIFLGCVMDALAMVLLTIPIFFPLAMSLGFDPIWFGIIIVRVVEIGMITPPIGINVYVISGVAKDVPMQTIFKGIIPFLIADFFHVILLLFVPQISLFLPNLMQ
ncbi:TRAP transporter large permease [Thermodesulfobacteriota bacterium]